MKRISWEKYWTQKNYNCRKVYYRYFNLGRYYSEELELYRQTSSWYSKRRSFLKRQANKRIRNYKDYISNWDYKKLYNIKRQLD